MRRRVGLALAAIAAISFAWLLVRRGGTVTPAERPARTERPSTTAASGPGMADPTRPVLQTNLKVHSAELELFSDPGIPLEQRRAEIARLAAAGDPGSIGLLVALGDGQVYLSFEAVEALGSTRLHGEPRRPEVVQYLEAKLGSDDAVMACAAVRALARLEGEGAVPSLLRLLEAQRGRPDGYEHMVETVVIDALADIGSPLAVPALFAQLGRIEEPGFSLEQGSSLIRALGRINAEGTASAARTYAERLAGRVPDDPLAKPYTETKVAEARALAEVAR